MSKMQVEVNSWQTERRSLQDGIVRHRDGINAHSTTGSVSEPRHNKEIRG